jgi:arabinogalactan oligomer/maltooligosaccharide transport system substrate-binding protein
MLIYIYAMVHSNSMAKRPAPMRLCPSPRWSGFSLGVKLSRLGMQWTLLTTFVVALALTACNPSLADSPPSFDGDQQPSRSPAPLPTQTTEPVTVPTQLVSIWLDWDTSELQGLYKVIEHYQLEHPEVEFAITYRPREDLLVAFERAAAAGQGPSILLGPSWWGPSLRENNYILNLSPLLDPGMESDIYPIAWSQAAHGTQLFGLPLELHGIVLYRNRTLAAQPVAELDEWLAAADQLESDTFRALVPDLGLETSLPMIAACGEEIFNAQGDLLVFGEGGTCWLSLLKRIAGFGGVIFDSEEDVQQFKNGQAAWLIASTELRAELIDAIGVTNLKVDPWPLYEDTGFPLRGFTWTENAYLVAGSTERDLESTWNFLQFLFGFEGQEILSDPASVAHIPSTGALEPPDSLMLEASSMLRAGIPLPIHGELKVVEEPLLGAIRAVVLQGADPAFALALAEERLDLLRSNPQSP